MRWFQIFFLIIFVAVIAALGAVGFLKYRFDHSPDNHDLVAAIDRELGKVQKSNSFYGAVVGVYKQGQVFTKAYGASGPNGSAVLPPDAVFEVGSISKVFTSSLLQIMADDGVLSLDDKLSDILGDKVEISSDIARITLRQLATHTSGLPRLSASFFDESTDPLNPYAGLKAEHLKAYLANPTDIRPPGKFEYSNLGMGLLGYVLEQVSGDDWDTLVQAKILAPLDMRQSGQNMTPSMLSKFTPAYDAEGNETPHWDLPILTGAGALRSDVDDMLKFIAANLTGDQALSESLKRTHPVNGEGGLGWMPAGKMERFLGNKTAIWHNGMVGGHASYMSIDPKNEAGVVVLSNQALDVTMTGIMLTRAVRVNSFKSDAK